MVPDEFGSSRGQNPCSARAVGLPVPSCQGTAALALRHRMQVEISFWNQQHLSFQTVESMSQSRRSFLKSSAAGIFAAGFQTIVPPSVFGAMTPSNRVNIGATAVGRISRVHDMPSVIKSTGVEGRDNRLTGASDLR